MYRPTGTDARSLRGDPLARLSRLLHAATEIGFFPSWVKEGKIVGPTGVRPDCRTQEAGQLRARLVTPVANYALTPLG